MLKKTVSSGDYMDLHVHLLPCLDDGPSSTEESLELARALVRQGYRTVAATPHCYEGSPSVEEILWSCRRFREELKGRGIPLKVLPGAEVSFSSNLPKLLENGDLVFLGGGRSWLLLELSL